MPLEAIKLRIQTPIEWSAPGRGFYQRDEESLYVQVGLFSEQHRFFSYIESQSVRFDLDKDGRLVFIEVSAPRRQWQIDPHFCPPSASVQADIRWLNFRAAVPSPRLLTDSIASRLAIRFGELPPAGSFLLAESIIVEFTRENCLVAIWITDIVDDVAGLKLAAFRRAIRAEGDRKAPQWPAQRLPAL